MEASQAFELSELSQEDNRQALRAAGAHCANLRMLLNSQELYMPWRVREEILSDTFEHAYRTAAGMGDEQKPPDGPNAVVIPFPFNRYSPRLVDRSPESRILLEPKTPLFPVERLELAAASYGLSADEAAKARVVGLKTVRTHRREIIKKFGTTMAGAVNRAILCGMLEVEPREPDGWVKSITPREMEILDCIAAGLKNAEIAEQLNIATRTVCDYSHKLLRELGAKNRVHAVRKAYEYGLYSVLQTSEA